MSILIYKSLKGKKLRKSWKSVVNYSLKELINHLEKQFDENMSWDNYGTYWWIDHIKPRASFHFTSPDSPEFKECWALENLQPMEKIANIKKGKRYKPK